MNFPSKDFKPGVLYQVFLDDSGVVPVYDKLPPTRVPTRERPVVIDKLNHKDMFAALEVTNVAGPTDSYSLWKVKVCVVGEGRGTGWISAFHLPNVNVFEVRTNGDNDDTL